MSYKVLRKLHAYLVIESELKDREVEYCSFREITALVVTWNAGASTPAHFRYEENEPRFFEEVLQASKPPDLLVFGFQELVDLEDKRLTASSYRRCRPCQLTARSNGFQRRCLKRIGRRIPQSKNT